jgi:hypothetical protein
MSGMATDRRGRGPRPAALPSAGEGRARHAPTPPAEQPALAQVIPHPRALARMKSARQRTVPPGTVTLTGAGTAGSHATARRRPPGSRPVTPVEARQRMPRAGTAVAPGTRGDRPQRIPPAGTAAAPGTRDAAPRTPRTAARRVRLTRRGRVVVTGFIVAGVLLVAALAWLALAGPAQAAGPGARSGSVYRNLATVVVRPGQTLWSIAVRAEPGADPRVVIREIADLNALSGTVVEPGQQLLVPRDK